MDIAPINEKTGYMRWMKGQGLPIHVGHGKADLRTLAVGRTSGFKVSHQRTDDDVFRSVEEAVWFIPDENEDPEIPRRYQGH